jgi:hypothetical protein
MGAEYQQFDGQAEFQADPGIVREAIRDFAGNWLAGWKLSEAPDGIEATGQSGGHNATAIFLIVPAVSGASLALTLKVEQGGQAESAWGDGDEDYDNLVRKWLEALPWWVQQKQTPPPQPADLEEKIFIPELPKRRRRIGDILASSFLILWLLVITLYALAALIGLVTGELKLPSKRTGDLVTTQGWAARIVSVVILAIYGSIVSSIWKWRKKHKGKPWF